jgi:hypothetical protein
MLDEHHLLQKLLILQSGGQHRSGRVVYDLAHRERARPSTHPFVVEDGAYPIGELSRLQRQQKVATDKPLGFSVLAFRSLDSQAALGLAAQLPRGTFTRQPLQFVPRGSRVCPPAKPPVCCPGDPAGGEFSHLIFKRGH